MSFSADIFHGEIEGQQIRLWWGNPPLHLEMSYEDYSLYYGQDGEPPVLDPPSATLDALDFWVDIIGKVKEKSEMILKECQDHFTPVIAYVAEKGWGDLYVVREEMSRVLRCLNQWGTGVPEDMEWHKARKKQDRDYKIPDYVPDRFQRELNPDLRFAIASYRRDERRHYRSDMIFEEDTGWGKMACVNRTHTQLIDSYVKKDGWVLLYETDEPTEEVFKHDQVYGQKPVGAHGFGWMQSTAQELLRITNQDYTSTETEALEYLCDALEGWRNKEEKLTGYEKKFVLDGGTEADAEAEGQVF